MTSHDSPEHNRPVEVAAEALAEQVEGEGVDAGGGEAEDSGQQGDDEVGQRYVRLVVVEGPVHVEHVVGEPAEGEQTHEHQHDLRQALPRLHLEMKVKQTTSLLGDSSSVFPVNQAGVLFVRRAAS